MTGTLNIISRQAKALYDIPPPWKYATSASVLPDCLDAVGYVSGSYTSRILSHSEQKCQCDGESFLFFLIPHRRRISVNAMEKAFYFFLSHTGAGCSGLSLGGGGGVWPCTVQSRGLPMRS